MSKELIPKPISQVPAIRILRTSLPVVVAGAGLLDLLFIGTGFGIMLLLLGSIWFFGGWIRARLAAVEAGGATTAETPEERARKELKRRLMRLQGVEGCERLAEHATDLLVAADERIRSFDRLLRSKLQPTELTFSRYRGAAEQVYLSIVDRLGEVAELLNSIESIHPSEVRAKLKNARINEEAALKGRLADFEKQSRKAEALMSDSEHALTELDHANVALTDMKTQPGLAGLELPEALKQLEELAKRAGRYSSSKS